MENLLSIVIPTRNREKYCIEAMKHILSFEENCFELIIQDNSDSDSIEEYVNNNPDSRLRYNRVKGRINSVINMRASVDLACGEYVCMIGDDDTVLPNIFSVVRWAKSNNIKAVTPKLSYGYLWNHDGNLMGKLVAHKSTSITKQLNANEQLDLLINNGIIQYYNYDLPRLYHGLLRKDVIDSIRNVAGHSIGGLSPDIYLSVSSCFYIDTYYKVNFPFTIPGSCIQSTSVGKPRGRFEEIPHLWNRGEYEWDSRIPKYYCAQTIWAESALQAIKENDKGMRSLPQFNKNYFLTVFWIQNKDRHFEIKEELGDVQYMDIKNALRYRVRNTLSKVHSALHVLIKERRVYDNLPSWNGVLDIIKNEIIFF